ncbi:hypothetical protein F4679DRAFT_518287 [Xylaria curta]|nr:hypothetical protein F4679DRAFT_518287 [Xylaria curta]
MRSAIYHLTTYCYVFAILLPLAGICQDILTASRLKFADRPSRHNIDVTSVQGMHSQYCTRTDWQMKYQIMNNQRVTAIKTPRLKHTLSHSSSWSWAFQVARGTTTIYLSRSPDPCHPLLRIKEAFEYTSYYKRPRACLCTLIPRKRRSAAADRIKRPRPYHIIVPESTARDSCSCVRRSTDCTMASRHYAGPFSLAG